LLLSIQFLTGAFAYILSPFFHPSIYSLVRLFIYSFIPSFIHSFNHSSTHLSIRSFIHWFIHSFVHSLTHLFIHSFVRSFIFFTCYVAHTKIVNWCKEKHLWWRHYVTYDVIIQNVFVENKVEKLIREIAFFFFNPRYW